MRNLFLPAFFLISLIGNAQAPFGYYESAEGLEGETLREALHQIIDDHNSQSYGSLWNHFEETDDKPNGQVWDIYSDNPDGAEPYVFEFGNDQCGNYGGEGDCYNREHSFPKSWFGDQSPMNSDLFHIYPTDGYVNGIRGNYPFGEVGAANYTSENGSIRGNCIYPGYSQVVFEPIDEYKGDLARSYFYMLTRYKDLINTWNSPMLSGDDFSSWALNLLLEWSALDPVSQKEIDRNNEIWTIQENRNPFIDHPEYVNLIWGETPCLLYDCGCLDESACNYDPTAVIADESCEYSCYGCTDPDSCNFDPEATIDNGTCKPCACIEDFDNNGIIGTTDLLFLVSYFGCTENCASSDLDLNGVVGTNDMLMLLSIFGEPCGN